MKLWIKVLALAGVLLGATIILLSFLFFWWRRRRQQQQLQSTASPSFTEMAAKAQHDNLQAGFMKLHLTRKSISSKNSLRVYHFHGHPDHQQQHHQQQNLPYRPPPPFNWDNHPRFVLEAVENGWARFTFTVPSSSVPQRSPSPFLSHFCAACDDGGRQYEPEINWEVPMGSSEFMQTVRLNPKRSGSSFKISSALHGDENSYCSISMGLPLPGPPLGGFSFPQEAYFEITILYLQPLQHKYSRSSKRAKNVSGSRESDKAKLIQENTIEFVHSVNGDGCSIDAKSVVKEEDRKQNNHVISLGLTTGGPPPTRSAVPGTYPGSICFNSNGSVFLDGMKLVFESEKTEWAGVNRVIGCGFNPRKKKVFFTVDSELVHVIQCNSDAYKSPLYPVLVANADVMVLVNLGQSAFKYAPANAQRTPNPCFLRPSPDNNAARMIGYEDSRELFSIGRIDSEWMVATKESKSNSSRSSKQNTGDGDEESILDGESDLFEIVLHS